MPVYAGDGNCLTRWDTEMHVRISQSWQLEGSRVGDLPYNTGCELGTATVAKNTPDKPRIPVTFQRFPAGVGGLYL